MVRLFLLRCAAACFVSAARRSTPSLASCSVSFLCVCFLEDDIFIIVLYGNPSKSELVRISSSFIRTAQIAGAYVQALYGKHTLRNVTPDPSPALAGWPWLTVRNSSLDDLSLDKHQPV